MNGCVRLFISEVEAREGITMLIWRYVVLLVCSMLVLSTFATSIILATQKGCVDIRLGKDGLTIHVDPQCGRPKDEQLDLRNAYSERPSHGVP